MDLNKAQVIGNVTTDIELKTVGNGNSVVNFSIATNRKWTDSQGNSQEKAEFHNIEMWGKLAEIAAQYLKKGTKAYVEGRLETKVWEAQDGTKRYKTSIVGENLIMLGSKPANNSNTQQTQTPTTSKPTPKQEEEIGIEDIPF